MTWISEASAFLQKNLIVVMVIALIGMVTWDMCRRRESFTAQSDEVVLDQAAAILSKMVAAQKMKQKGGVKPVVTDKGVVVAKPVVPVTTKSGKVVTMKPVMNNTGKVTMKPVVLTNKGKVVTMKPVVNNKGKVTMKPVNKAAGKKGGKKK